MTGIPITKPIKIKDGVTTDLWYEDGCLWGGSLSKCSGIKITSIWLIFPAYPNSQGMWWASKSAWHKVLSIPIVKQVGKRHVYGAGGLKSSWSVAQRAGPDQNLQARWENADATQNESTPVVPYSRACFMATCHPHAHVFQPPGDG